MAEVHIPSLLRSLTDGAKSVMVEGDTVGQLLDNMEAQYPGFKERIVDEGGAVKQFITIFIDDEDVRFKQNLNTPVKEEAVISILPAVAGGS